MKDGVVTAKPGTGCFLDTVHEGNYSNENYKPYIRGKIQ